MTKEALKKLLQFCMDRAEEAAGSCNQMHIRACLNQTRGAIRLETGDDPGTDFDNMEDICKILNVKYTVKGDMIYFDDFPDL